MSSDSLSLSLSFERHEEEEEEEEAFFFDFKDRTTTALIVMPPKKTTTTKKGPGRPTKKKKTTPEPPPTAASGGRRRRREEEEDDDDQNDDQNNNPGGGFVGTRIEVEYGTGGTRRWYVGTIISAKPAKNLALVFYEFDKQLGIIDFPKLKKDTRLVPKATRWTEKMMRVLLTKELKIKNESDMEKEWMKQEGKRIESDENDESDEEDDDDEDNNNETTDITKTTTTTKKNGGDDTIPDEVYETLSTDGSWRWPTMNELFETKMVKAGATTGRVAFVLTTIKFKEAYREEEGGPVAEAGAVMVSVGACVRVKEKNRLIRVDQIDEKKGTFRGVRIITRNECRNEWVGKFIDVCPKQGLKPSEIKRMSDKEANEYEVFVTEDDSGWIDISDVVEVMNARHHLVQPPKKKSLEDNVFETRVATMKFMNAGATGKKGTELEAKIFRTKKVTCLSTFTRDEKTIASERKRVMDSVAALFEENGDAKKSAKKKTLAAGAADYKTPSTQKKQKSPTPAKKKGARVKEEEEEEEEEKVVRTEPTPEPSAAGPTTTTTIANVPPKKKKGIEVIDFIVPEEQKKKQEQTTKKRLRKEQEEEEQMGQKQEKNEKSALAVENYAAAVASETKTPQYKRPLIGQKSTPMASSAGGTGFLIPKQSTATPTPAVVSGFQSTTAPPPLPPNPAAEKLQEAMNRLKAEYANWPNFQIKNGRKSTFLFGPTILAHPLNPHARPCNKCGKVGHFQRDCPLMKYNGSGGGAGVGGVGGLKCFNCNGFGHKSVDCPHSTTNRQQQQHRQRERW